MEDSRFEIRPAGEKGNGLFSLTRLSKGDIIFEEEPIVSCQFAWNEDYGYMACNHCLRPLETALENARRLAMNDTLNIPYSEKCLVDKAKHVSCPSCYVKYCSEECQEKAWNTYHKTLCFHKFENDLTHPLELLKELWKQMHIPPDSSSFTLFIRIFALIHQAEDKSKILNIIKQFHHHALTEDLYHRILGLQTSEQMDILRENLIKCVPTESATQWVTPDGFRSLVTLVGMNVQGIGTSAVSDWVKSVNKMNMGESEREEVNKFITKLYEDFDNAVGVFLNNEGSGLYVIQSNINHSCQPNAEITFPNSNYRLAVKCVEDILPDEEICINYVDDCIFGRSRYTRQRILKSQFLFQCRCRKCIDEVDQPDETSEEETESEDEEMN